MSRIRPLVADDIPTIVALRQQTFKQKYHSSPEALSEYMTTLFLDGPWHDDSAVARVRELRGTPGGIHPRLRTPDDVRRRTDSRRDLHAVDDRAASRGVTGLALLRECLRGPQDLSFSDAVNEAGRRVLERLGGTTALLHSVYWTRPLRPWRYAASRMGSDPMQRAIRVAARPLLALADAAAARAIRGATRDAAGLPARELTVDDVMTHNAAMNRGHDSRPHVSRCGWPGGDRAARTPRAKARCRVGGEGCVLGRDGPRTVVHSSKPEVLATIERGDALLTRLDGSSG
jgi:hypothetical protein